MKRVRFIGDVHGVWNYDYYPHLRDCETSVQVGDMGVGFILEDGVPSPPPDLARFPGCHRYIRGNHDNPQECAKDPHWIPDGLYQDGVFYVGGGLSIDREYRIEGRTWWPDEELSHQELGRVVDFYTAVQPRVVVSHDCPEEVAGAMMAAFNRVKFDDGSRTRQAFQVMLERHQPKLWVFGHWHVSLDFRWGPTRFVCLGIGEAKDIDLDEYL